MKSVIANTVNDTDILKTYVEYNSSINNEEIQSNSKELIKRDTITKSISSSEHHSKIYILSNLFLKRTIDIVGALVGITILIPLTIVVAIINLISGDRGPLFYCQDRIGKNGKYFKMYKFRSMVEGADEKLKDLLENDLDAKKEFNTYKKLKNDPRITKIGKTLRKTNLDEFPQFINVLKGDMSLVGPRPYLPREKDELNEYYSYLIQSKPGVTGLWQVSGGSNITFDERVIMECQYINNYSIINDIKIIFKTIFLGVKKN